jgi:hypothetical protein
MNSTPGSVTYAGLTLTARLKIESSTSITYTTTAASTLTLIFDSNFTGTIKVNNVYYTPNAGIVTVSLPAGANTITKVLLQICFTYVQLIIRQVVWYQTIL